MIIAAQFRETPRILLEATATALPAVIQASLRAFLRGSVRLLVPGLAAGLVLAAIAARLASSMLADVNVLNPLTYLAVAALECLIVVVACLGPALRASRVDPLVALRAQ